MLGIMRWTWIRVTFNTFVIVLLIAAILGITTATLMPAIYRSAWFQNKYVHPPK